MGCMSDKQWCNMCLCLCFYDLRIFIAYPYMYNYCTIVVYITGNKTSWRSDSWPSLLGQGPSRFGSGSGRQAQEQSLSWRQRLRGWTVRTVQHAFHCNQGRYVYSIPCRLNKYLKKIKKSHLWLDDPMLTAKQHVVHIVLLVWTCMNNKWWVARDCSRVTHLDHTTTGSGSSQDLLNFCQFHLNIQVFLTVLRAVASQCINCHQCSFWFLNNPVPVSVTNAFTFPK